MAPGVTIGGMWRRLAALAATALSVSLACQPPPLAPAQAARSRPVPPAPSAPPAGPGPVAAAEPAPLGSPAPRAKIRFEAREREFPLPLVDVRVAGLPARMVLDTGATRHVLADWVVREARVVTRASSVETADHTGKRIEVLEADPSALAIDGWAELPAAPALLVSSLPPQLRSLGVVGILSPQLLAAEGSAVVLDLPRREMAAMQTDRAIATYASAG